MVLNGDLPILQDTAEQDVWTSWGATWRDVVIVDPTNARFDTFNLTTYNLADELNRTALKAKLVDAATP